MYKFLLVFIILLVILIIALNIGVLPSLTKPQTEGYTNSQKRVTWIGYRTGGRVDQITLGFNTLEVVNYGLYGGQQRPDIILTPGEFIQQIIVYGNSAHNQYRGGKFNFKTNKRDIILDTNQSKSPTFAPEQQPRISSNERPQYMIPATITANSKPIIGLKWSSNLNDANAYIAAKGYKNNTAPTTAPNVEFCSNETRHAWLIDVEYGTTIPTIDDKLFKQLLNQVSSETGFSFNIVESDTNSTVLSTVQHLDYVHNIRLYDIVSTGSINPNHSEYVKLIEFIKTIQSSGINTINELIALQSDIRTTKSTQGFTNIREGLTSDGRLTDAEAVCYLNSNDAARDQIAAGYATGEDHEIGLNFTIYNSYFNLNMYNNTLNWWNNNAYLHQPGHNGFTGELELSRLFDAKDSAPKCNGNPDLIYEKNLASDLRNNGNICVIASGVVLDLANIDNATRDLLNDRKQLIRNDHSAEYYTVVWSGYFRPDATGNWKFRIAGDDGVYVFLDTGRGFPRTLADAANTAGATEAGLQGFTRKEGSDVYLEKGRFYPFMAIFGENWGGDNMYVHFKGPAGSKATDWTSNGMGYYFRSSGAPTTVSITKQDSFPLHTINLAKQHWEANGKPVVNCTSNMRTQLTGTDAINYGKYNYGFYQYEPANIDNKVTGYKNEWSSTGKPSTYIYTLPKVEPFVEGLAIDENKIDKYVKEMADLGINKNDIPSALRDFKATYGLDIASPGKVSTFFGPLRDFGITDYSMLRSFKNTFMADNIGFISLNQLPEFMTYMSTFGMRYSQDPNSTYQKFLQQINGFGIPTLNKLKDFHKILESIGYPPSTNPLSLITSIQPYGVNNYTDTTNYVKQMNNYLTDKTKGPEITNSLVSFGIQMNTFDGFLSNSHGVSSAIIVQYINTYKSFGISYLDRNNSTALYTNFFEVYVRNVNIEQGQEVAMKNINVINIYRGYGFNSYAELIDTSVTKARSVGNSGARLDIYPTATNPTILQFLKLTQQNMNEFKTRLNKALDDSSELFPQSICNITLFFTAMFTNMSLTHDVFKNVIMQNKSLFMAQVSDHISCPTDTTASTIASIPQRSGFTTIEGLNEGRIFKSTTPFGITNYAQAAYDNVSRSYIDINSLNSTFSMFDIRTVDQYKLFMDEMLAFGVSNQNVIAYTNKLSEFGIKYNNFLSFTIYIRTIGVKYSGFDVFINQIMKMGVYAPDLLSFLCYLYEFGVTYEDNPNSQFFQFIDLMDRYGLRYVTVSNEDQSIRFTNAIQNFVYIISRGQDTIQCSVENIQTDSANSREVITNNANTMVKVGEEKKRKNYARYMFPFTPNSEDSIIITIPQLMDVCKTIDEELLDFCTLNPYIRTGKLGFNCDITTAPFNLNLPNPATGKLDPSSRQALHISYRKFMKYFAERDVMSDLTSQNTNKKAIIDVALVTSFMQDTAESNSAIMLNEYNNLSQRKILTPQTIMKVLTRLENHNISENGNADNSSVYAYYNMTINAIKLFPNFSIKYIKYFIENSPDMNIPRTLPNGKPHPRASSNPENTRCSPYIKVDYDKKGCSETFTSRNNYAKSSWTPPAVVGQPVQLVGGVKPTIQSTMFSTLKPNDKYSTVNW